MTKKEKILKAAEFEFNGAAIKNGWDIDGNGEQVQSQWIYERCVEALSETKPLITAMADRIEQLEAALGNILRMVSDMEGDELNVDEHCEVSLARQALQPGELDKILEGM